MVVICGELAAKKGTNGTENDVTDVYVHAARTVPGIREIEDFYSHVSLSPVSLNRGRRRVYNAASFHPPPLLVKSLFRSVALVSLSGKLGEPERETEREREGGRIVRNRVEEVGKSVEIRLTERDGPR